MLGRRRSLCSVNSFIAFLFVATVIVAFLVMMEETPAPTGSHFKYSTVTGYFLQDDAETDSQGFDYTTTNYGLKDRTYPADEEFDSDNKLTQWQRLAHHVSKLNEDSDSKTTYRLLYLGRHGEGFHNVAEAFYGREAWDCYWSLQDGNSTSNWSDALLTPSGEAQAQRANDFWRSQIAHHKIPTPESYYTSPLLRCMATASISFSGLDLPEEHPFVPTIKEGFREVIGAHTCDRRSSKTTIHEKYPNWPIEEGFAEDDPLWSATLRETDEAIDQRTLKVFDDVFSTDGSTYISVSAHSGQIASALRVLGHRDFGLGTGQAIPVFVKAERVAGSRPPEEDAPWETVTPCSTAPPAAKP